MSNVVPNWMLAQQDEGDMLYDIVVLKPVAPIWPLILWAVLILLFLAALGWVVWYFLRPKKSQKVEESPRDKASRRFRRIRQGADSSAANELVLEASETLKDYLAEKFNDPVRFETAQEFLGRISGSETKLPNAAQQELRGFLVSAEEIKFGNAPDAANRSEPLLKAAENVVSLCETISH